MMMFMFMKKIMIMIITYNISHHIFSSIRLPLLGALLLGIISDDDVYKKDHYDDLKSP